MRTPKPFRTSEPCRTVRFAPYRAGMGPTFTLRIWNDLVPGWDHYGRLRVAYELRQHAGGVTSVLLQGDDIHLSAGTCTDSNRAVAEIMGWLTLRPGDTDGDFFSDYTPAQLDFCSTHAEALNMTSIDRWGEY